MKLYAFHSQNIAESPFMNLLYLCFLRLLALSASLVSSFFRIDFPLVIRSIRLSLGFEIDMFIPFSVDRFLASDLGVSGLFEDGDS